MFYLHYFIINLPELYYFIKIQLKINNLITYVAKLNYFIKIYPIQYYLIDVLFNQLFHLKNHSKLLVEQISPQFL